MQFEVDRALIDQIMKMGAKGCMAIVAIETGKIPCEGRTMDRPDDKGARGSARITKRLRPPFEPPYREQWDHDGVGAR